MIAGWYVSMPAVDDDKGLIFAWKTGGLEVVIRTSKGHEACECTYIPWVLPMHWNESYVVHWVSNVPRRITG